MILYITRKHPPSVGGMQRQSQGLAQSLGQITPVYVLRWSHSQIWLPAFLLYAFFAAIVLRPKRNFRILLLGDLALAPLGVALHRILRIPVAAYAHGLDVICTNSLYRRFVSVHFAKLDHIICNSACTRAAVLSHGIPMERTSIVNPGIWPKDRVLAIDQETLHQARRRWRIADDAKLILFVGRLIPRKGCAHLVAEVLPRLRAWRTDWHCLVVGDGPEMAKVTQLARDYGLGSKVTLLGQISDGDLETAYLASHVLVMPNLAVQGDTEGFGMVALEARSAGLSVVAYDVDGISDSFVYPQDGILVQPADPNAFAEAISTVLDEDLTIEIREARRARVQEVFGWPTIAAKLLTRIKPLAPDLYR